MIPSAESVSASRRAASAIPLLADALSDVRFGVARSLAGDRCVRRVLARRGDRRAARARGRRCALGAMPTSKPLLQYLRALSECAPDRGRCPGGWRDPTGLATTCCTSTRVLLCDALRTRAESPSPRRAGWVATLAGQRIGARREAIDAIICCRSTSCSRAKCSPSSGDCCRLTPSSSPATACPCATWTRFLSASDAPTAVPVQSWRQRHRRRRFERSGRECRCGGQVQSCW